MPDKKKVVAIIQVRMTSTRLPGKALMPIEDKPMTKRVVERLRQSALLNEIVLAIPDTQENDALADFAKQNDIIYVRGSEEDVLGRYYKTAKERDADVVVRITADCPLVDPSIVDRVVQEHIEQGSDYTSNVIERTYPRGLDVEVFNFDILEKIEREAKEPHQREHVTPYILENPQLFKLQNVSAKGVLLKPNIRLTVDTKEDLIFVRSIYKYFSDKDFFSATEAIEFLEQNPDLLKINADIQQKPLNE